LQAHCVVLAEAGSIPKTTSGKLQRFACREEFLKGDLKTVGISTLDDISQSPGASPSASHEFTGITAAPETFKFRREKIFAAAAEQRRGMIEQDLIDRLLGLLKPATATLDVAVPLYTFGVDSLAAAELKNFTAEAFGLDLPITTFLEEISIEQLADQVLERISVEQLVYSVRMDEPNAADESDWEILKI
jgi:acyl carrier protein